MAAVRNLSSRNKHFRESSIAGTYGQLFPLLSIPNVDQLSSYPPDIDPIKNPHNVNQNSRPLQSRWDCSRDNRRRNWYFSLPSIIIYSSITRLEGIGLMMAKALALNGAKKVYIVGRRLDKLEEAAKECPNGNIIPLQGDVTSKESLENCADYVRKEIGYINLVICNSGVTGPSHAVNLPADTSAKDLQKQVMSTPMEDFTQAFAVNVSGVYYTAFAFLDLLEEGNKEKNALDGVKSQVLVTGSIAAYNRSVGAGIAYNTSKAAVTHLVKILAGIFVPYSVRVNALAPGCMLRSFLLCMAELYRLIVHSVSVGDFSFLIGRKRRCYPAGSVSEKLYSCRENR
jgi:NAD(P)-dependent dehydrogenase (short-subunit alcohol dehydrogenase family)